MKRTRQNSSQKHRPRSKPKGRQVKDEAARAVGDLLKEAPLDRASLIEHLHTLNDAFGHLSAQHIAALAQRMGLGQIDVYETATFYSHFKVLKDGERPPPALNLRICNGPACRMAGAKTLFTEALAAFGDQVNVLSAPCQGACDTAPSAILGQHRISPASLETLDINTITASPLPPCAQPTDPGSLDAQTIITLLEQAGLRGLGGAGFAAANKWRFFDGAPHPRVLVVNADEGEPGTFKDRFLFENHMHQVLNGMLVAARALEVQDIFVYLRDEYAHILQALSAVLSDLPIDGITIHLRRGAGAYICGEETALLESLEGKRGLPRNRPPYPAQSGYLGRPTVIHNVETLYWIGQIFKHGAAWYVEQQRPRFYSISGRVRQPGVYRAPSTATVSELIEAADGLTDGHVFKAFLPGGASGGIFPARLADQVMDFGVFEKFGGFVGSGALTVLSDHDDVWDVAETLSDFFADESCGQCTPCRIGTQKLAVLIKDPPKNESLIRELASAMREASICGLGQAAANPILTLLDHGLDHGEDDT